MIRLHRLFERCQVLVHVLGLQEHFGGRAPHHDQPVTLVLFLEVANVFANLLGEIEFRLALLDVRALQVLDEILIERSLHRLDGLQEFLYLCQIFRVEHAGLRGRLIGVVGKHVPAAENQIIEFRERHQILDLRSAAFGPLAEADGAQLRERSHGHGFAAPDELDSRHERGADSSHSGQSALPVFPLAEQYSRACAFRFPLIVRRW